MSTKLVHEVVHEVLALLEIASLAKAVSKGLVELFEIDSEVMLMGWPNPATSARREEVASRTISMTSEAASKSFTSPLLAAFARNAIPRSAVGVKRHRKVPFFLRGDPFFVRIRGCLSQKTHLHRRISLQKSKKGDKGVEPT